MHRNPNNPKKILVLNGDNRNGLAVVRSLGRKKHQCDITTTKRHTSSLKLASLLKSKYVRRVYYLPPVENELNFLDELQNLISHVRYDYLLASGTQASNFLSKFKDTLSQYASPLVEDYSKLWALHNKIECLKLAQSFGIPVPKTYSILKLADLKHAAREISYPVVVKYADSYSSQGLWKFQKGGSDLVKEYIRRVPQIQQNKRQIPYPLIQEYISGSLMDTTAFAIDGEVIAMLSQERLLTAWLDGGGGLVNITNNEPEIKKYTRIILGNIKWTGPIEMDWIKDEVTKDFKLLEVNPKFWGTTQLTISAGFDYPSWLIDQAEGKDIQIPHSYTCGLMYRWIFDELDAIISLSQTKKRLAGEFKEFWRRFKHKPSMTNIWLSDFKPSIKDSIFFIYKLLFSGTFIKALQKLK
jgi:predicted ATP-grasp superfamily ATP-dependent carboligase